MLINVKTFDELMSQALVSLKAKGIDNTPGSIARLFLSVINECLSEAYEVLSLNHANAFVSTATGEALDAIGVLVNCHREAEETDDNYRFRITKQTLNHATANETAIRLSLLSVPQISDVVLRPYTLGAGSFSVMVISNKSDIDDALLNDITERVKSKTAFGTKFVVERPQSKKVSLSIKLMLKESVNEALAQNIRFDVREAVRRHIADKKIGESIIISELTQVIMNAHSSISSYTCETFKIDERRVSYVNQACEWNERFVVNHAPDAIVIL